MEFLDGINLADLISEQGAVKPSVAQLVFLQTCEAMEHSHANGILHRDLKPTNIILMEQDSDSPVVKVVDFGLAMLKDRDDRLTPTRRGIGSPLYMAAEQAEGANVDERSDIYSIGCLMYEALSGNPPFVGESALDTLMMHKVLEPVSLCGKVDFEGVEEWDEIVSRCLEKNPEKRYQNFASLRNDLEQLNFQDVEDSNDDIEDSSAEKSMDSQVVQSIKYRKESVVPRQTSPAVRAIPLVVGLVCFVSLLFLFKGIQSVPEVQSTKKSQRYTIVADKEKLRPQDRFFIKRAGAVLDVSGISVIDDSDLALLKEFNEISILDLRRDSVMKGKGFRELKDVSIEELHIEKAMIDDSGLEDVANIKNLKTLYINEADYITNEGVRVLQQCPTLRLLYISGKNLTEDFLTELEPMKLTGLYIRNMEFSKKGIQKLHRLKHLESVQFFNCKIPMDAFELLAKNPTKISRFMFTNRRLRDKEIDLITKIPGCKLQLDNDQISRNGLMKLKGCKNIFSLQAVCLDEISPEEIAILRNSLRLPIFSVKNKGEVFDQKSVKYQKTQSVFDEIGKEGPIDGIHLDDN